MKSSVKAKVQSLSFSHCNAVSEEDGEVEIPSILLLQASH